MARHGRLPGRHPPDPAAVAAGRLSGRGVWHLRLVRGLFGDVGGLCWECAGCGRRFEAVAAEGGRGERGWGAAGLKVMRYVRVMGDGHRPSKCGVGLSCAWVGRTMWYGLRLPLRSGYGCHIDLMSHLRRPPMSTAPKGGLGKSNRLFIQYHSSSICQGSDPHRGYANTVQSSPLFKTAKVPYFLFSPSQRTRKCKRSIDTTPGI